MNPSTTSVSVRKCVICSRTRCYDFTITSIILKRFTAFSA
jgi:hypothetical protein